METLSLNSWRDCVVAAMGDILRTWKPERFLTDLVRDGLYLSNITEVPRALWWAVYDSGTMITMRDPELIKALEPAWYVQILVKADGGYEVYSHNLPLP